MEPNNMQPGTEPVQTPNQGQDDVRIIGEMPRRPANIFNIAGTNAALAGCDPRARRFHLARKKRLERRHSRSNHQKRRIVLRNQRCTAKP